MTELSPAAALMTRLVAAVGRESAHRIVDVALAKFSIVELAALEAHWRLWARPKQVPPATSWRSWGALAGRMFGKTRANAEHVLEEVLAGRAGFVGLAAQNEEKTIALQIEGKSGLMSRSPPWFRPRWEATKKQLVFPNGAIAYALTPESPGGVRGYDLHLSWLSELQSWPVQTREEAFRNFQLATRLGYARTIWDATPKRGHPILRSLLERAKQAPDKHIVVRGSSYENAMNVGEGVIEDVERDIGGTQRGREELGGEMLEDSELAIAKQEWIERSRRPMPDGFARRGLGLDPAVTARAGSDRTGIIEAGLGHDAQAYVLDDLSGKHDPPTWAKLTLDRYVKNSLDVIVVETNKGGDLVVQNLRAAAAERGLRVVVIGRDAYPRGQRGIVYVKEVHARGPKADRAQPLSTAYEQGRVSHVIGVDLTSLETTLTTWEPTPGARSPDDLDATTHIVAELLRLTSDAPDPSGGFEGLAELERALRAGGEAGALAQLSSALRGGGRKI